MEINYSLGLIRTDLKSLEDGAVEANLSYFKTVFIEGLPSILIRRICAPFGREVEGSIPWAFSSYPASGMINHRNKSK